MKTVIVGGGATGLATAFLLSKTGSEVTILEGADRPGGLMNSFDIGDCDRLEHFYHHFFTHDREINWLLSELGLSDRIQFRESTMGIYRSGKHYRFNGVRDLLSFDAMSWLGRFRFGISSALMAYRKSYSAREDQTALDWLYKTAGSDATNSIWRPMLEVKFGEAADRIPLAWMACRLRQRVLSRQSGVEKLGYLKGSLQSLTEALVEKIRDQRGSLQLQKTVRRFDRQEDQKIKIECEDGAVEICDRLIFTIPTPRLGNLFRDKTPTYARQLDSIKYLGAICTILSLKKPLSNVYWTNIADQQCDFGGVIEHTNLIPSECYAGQNLVYLSKYAESEDRLWNLSDQELVERQLDQLQKIYQRPVREDLNRYWVFRARNAAPLTDMGFRRRVPPFQTPVDNVFVASMCHLYPEERSVNNSIRVTAELLDTMGEHHAASLVPRGISQAGSIGRPDPRATGNAEQGNAEQRTLENRNAA